MTIKSPLAFNIILLFLSMNIMAGEDRSVNHYVEANLDANYILTEGNRLTDQTFFASGYNIAHGTNITSVHALVLSYGKSFSRNGNTTLTSKAFFLRRYLPKYSTSEFKLYSTIGSGAYRLEKNNGTEVVENAGIIIGIGSDWIYSDKLRFSAEADYRGYMAQQFNNKTTDSVRPFTLYLGLRYYYNSTKY